MGAAWIIYAEERSLTYLTAPSVEDITLAFRYAARGTYDDPETGMTHSRVVGHWVGPAPRVTLHNQLGGRYVTRAAWLYELTDAEVQSLGSAQALAGFPVRLVRDVEESLAARASHGINTWEVRAIPYSSAHGTRDWWASGRASTEAVFINNWQDLLSRLTPEDNPTGPNNPLAQGAGGDPTKNWSRDLAWIVGGTAAIILAVQFGPALASWIPTKSKPKAALANPRRQHR